MPGTSIYGVALMDTNRPAEQEIAPENPVLNEDAAQSTEIEANSFRIAGRMVFASIVIGTLAIGVAGWAATAELSGAVIAPGSVVVERNTKKVQHSDGGIVAKINVKDGDSVKAGEVLVVLDDTQIKAELSVVRGQLIELTARKARLTAEVAGDDKIVYPADFVTSSKHAKEVADGERRLFRETRTNILSQQEQLSLRIEQLEHEIKGIDSQQIAKHGQLVLIRKELEKITSLYNKKLTSVTRLYALEREEKRLSGEYAGLSAQIARTKGKISETRVQMLAAEQTAKLDAQRELRSTDAKAERTARA